MEITIKQSNIKMIFWGLICVVFVIGFFYTIDYILVNHVENGYNPTKLLRYKNFNIGVFSLGIVLCSIGVILVGILLIYRVSITINEDGFTYDGGIFSSFYIPWRNVVKIESAEVISAKMIKIQVRNKHELDFYKRSSKLLKRISSHVDYVTVTSSMFKIKHQELLMTLNKYWNEWKKNNEKAVSGT